MQPSVTQKFIYSWIMSTVVMFGMSYFWHGYILNDLNSIQLPLPFFLGMSALVYLIIGLLITFIYNALSFFDRQITKGISLGVAVGFFLYLIAFMLGVSFKAEGVQHVVIDFIWQMMEQGAGGIVVGFVYWHYTRKAQLLGHE